MKWLQLSLAISVTLAALLLCRQIISNSIANQANKSDYAELNHAKYGMLNGDEWKRRIIGILSEEVNKFEISRTNEMELRKHLEIILNTLIDKAAQQIRESNSASLGGWFKQAFIDVFINWQDIKKGIPDYAGGIIREIKTRKTNRQIRSLLQAQLEKFSKESYEVQDREPLRRILQARGFKDIETARREVNQAIFGKQNLIFRDSMLLILLVVVLFLFSKFNQQPLSHPHYLLLMLSLALLLLVGVTTPAIDIEARISQITFVVIGHPISFDNQVLYFQSKSLLDVFHILINYKGAQMKFVGVLLITFSVFFPALKMISLLVYRYNFYRGQENPVIRFFIFKSGKWSMADVMAVAIFMAYIGFNGMITSLFDQMQAAITDPKVVMLTTNGTLLQPGYFVFLTYTLLALVFSGFLSQRQVPLETNPGRAESLNVKKEVAEFSNN